MLLTAKQSVHAVTSTVSICIIVVHASKDAFYAITGG